MSGAILAALGTTISAPRIAITNKSVSYSSGGIVSASTAYRLDTDGKAYLGQGAISPSYFVAETWDTVASTVSNYEVFVSVSGSALSSGTTGSWVNLGAQQSWVLIASSGNLLTSTLSVSIRDVLTHTVQTSATITLTSNAV